MTTVTTLGTDCEACETPDNLYATDITFFRATLGWDDVPGAIRYRVQGRLKYNLFGFTVTKTVYDNQFRTNILFPFHAYEFRVKADCEDGGWTDYSYWEDFYLNPWANHREYANIDFDPNKEMRTIDIFETDKIFMVFQDISQGLIGVAYFGENLNEGEIRITDISGKEVHKEAFDLSTENSTILRSGELGAGMYFISLQKDGIILETEKVMLVK